MYGAVVIVQGGGLTLVVSAEPRCKGAEYIYRVVHHRGRKTLLLCGYIYISVPFETGARAMPLFLFDFEIE